MPLCKVNDDQTVCIGNQILFNSTKSNQVRTTGRGTLKYFIGKPDTDKKGFAVHPWDEVFFRNDRKFLFKNVIKESGLKEPYMAFVMGTYLFCYKNKIAEPVDYTFGYCIDPSFDPEKPYDPNNNIKWEIVLHHSALPFAKDNA